MLLVCKIMSARLQEVSDDAEQGVLRSRAASHPALKRVQEVCNYEENVMPPHILTLAAIGRVIIALLVFEEGYEGTKTCPWKKCSH